ncbi:MAG TPA: acetolactate synthase small subunit [Deltaproteobacteria bacterium]|nr:acetolactate synthase small subunit [Deltaproteobacteria bacterium]
MRIRLSVLVNNEYGVLSRVANLFAARGYNIESLNVAPTHDEGVSRMTIVVEGEKEIVEQIEKQLNRMVNCLKVINLNDQPAVERELVLIKMHTKDTNRAEILRITDIFRGNIVDLSSESYTIAISGDSGKINAVISLFRSFGIKEIARTGLAALTRELKTS